MRLLSKITNFFMTTIFNYRENDCHLWVRPIQDVRFEHEVHYLHLIDPERDDLCAAYNLIPDNKHEGLGWWEKVVVKRERGFTIEQKMKIFRRTDLNDATSGVATYLPQEVLEDIHKAPGHVIGFRPHNVPADMTSRVVWIHYV